MLLEPIVETPYLVTAVFRKFAVHMFHGKVTVEHMAAMEQRSDVWYAANPGQMVEMVVIFPSEARMTHEERVRMGRVIKRYERRRTASATVILADGLIGAAHRSVLTGLLLLAPPPHPAKVFGNTRDAVNWLMPYIGSSCGPEATSTTLAAALDTLARRFSATWSR